MSDPWKKSTTWSRESGDGFTVEVKNVEIERIPGVLYRANGWFIYAYVHNTHPYFNTLMRQKGLDSGGELGMHWGCTYRRDHRNDEGAVTCIQVGCDYRHYGDEYYESLETKEEAGEVFEDANRIFNILGNWKG